MLKRLKAAVRSLGRRAARGALFSWYYPHLYLKTTKEPVASGMVIFLDNKEGGLSDNFKVLYDRLARVPGLQLRLMTLGEGRGFRAYFRNCVRFVRAMATAQYVVLNDASSLVSCVPLRPETTVVQLWHGCGAFKKWGMSTADLKFGATREEIRRHPYYRNLSLVTVSSPEVVWAYEEAMDLAGEGIVSPTGVSRADVFFDDEFRARSRQRLERVVPQVAGKKIILYAPTFRGQVAQASAPEYLDVPAMERTLSDDYVLVVKHHPFIKRRPSIPAECREFAFDVSEELPIDELLCCADVCISDYSSLVFEFALFERPMVFLAPDRADYDDWRGFYYDYDELTPGPVVEDTQGVVDYIADLEERFDRQAVIAFKQKFMSACDGHATDRIIEAVFGPEVLAESKREGAVEARPLVSVIVPVYNAKKHLRECLDSIAAQTLERIEIICVDDGSTDGSLDMLYEYVAADSRFVVVTQKNQYAGVARNKGIEIARGDYLVFWDSDDYFDATALEKMHRQCEADGADICVCGARQLFQDTGKILHGPMYLVKKQVPAKRPFNRGTIPLHILTFTTMVVWNKMFRRSFVVEEGLRYAASRSNNDVEFAVCALCTARAITVVEEDLVTYRRNQGTALTNTLEAAALDPVNTWVATRRELERRHALPRISFANRAATSITYMLRNMTSYEGFKTTATYLRERGMKELGLNELTVRSPWQRAFFKALKDDGVEQALMVLMHETYAQQLAGKTKCDELLEEIDALRGRAS